MTITESLRFSLVTDFSIPVKIGSAEGWIDVGSMMVYWIAIMTPALVSGVLASATGIVRSLLFLLTSVLLAAYLLPRLGIIPTLLSAVVPLVAGMQSAFIHQFTVTGTGCLLLVIAAQIISPNLGVCGKCGSTLRRRGSSWDGPNVCCSANPVVTHARNLRLLASGRLAVLVASNSIEERAIQLGAQNPKLSFFDVMGDAAQASQEAMALNPEASLSLLKRATEKLVYKAQHLPEAQRLARRIDSRKEILHSLSRETLPGLDLDGATRLMGVAESEMFSWNLAESERTVLEIEGNTDSYVTATRQRLVKKITQLDDMVEHSIIERPDFNQWDLKIKLENLRSNLSRRDASFSKISRAIEEVEEERDRRSALLPDAERIIERIQGFDTALSQLPEGDESRHATKILDEAREAILILNVSLAQQKLDAARIEVTRLIRRSYAGSASPRSEDADG